MCTAQRAASSKTGNFSGAFIQPMLRRACARCSHRLPILLSEYTYATSARLSRATRLDRAWALVRNRRCALPTQEGTFLHRRVGRRPSAGLALARALLPVATGGHERDLPRGASPSTVDVARLVELTTQCKPEAARHWSTRTMAAELGVSAASVSRGVHQRAGVGCRHPPACRPSKHQTKPFIWSKTAADILQKVIRATSWVDEKAQRVGACAPGGDRNAQHQGNTGQVRSPALVPKPPLRQRFLARLQT